MRTLRRVQAMGLPLLLLTAGVACAANQLTIQVTGGPYAGAYQTTTDSTICMKAASQDVFSSAWKDFKASGRALAEAGIEVAHPDGTQPKRGRVRISFGKDGKAAIYELVNQAVTLTLTPQGARISGDGKTTDGIGLHVEAVCTDIDRL